MLNFQINLPKQTLQAFIKSDHFSINNQSSSAKNSKIQSFPLEEEDDKNLEDEQNISPPRQRSLGFSGCPLEFYRQIQGNSKEMMLKNLKPLKDPSKNPKEFVKNEEFLIKNIDTGELYDIRQLNQIEQLIPMIQKRITISNKKVWNGYWKEVRAKTEIYWDLAEIGDLEGLKLLLLAENSVYPIDLNAKSLDDYTALHLACNEGHIKVISLLLEQAQIDIEAKTSMYRTPLHIAAIKGYCDIVRLLVKAGCEVNSQDKDLNTPIYALCIRKRV